MDRKKIESWLEESLVPVEPSPRFVSDLHARLVNVKGGGGASPWMLVLVLPSVVILGVSILGFGLRLILGLLGVLGLLQRRRRESKAVSA